jgi:glycine/D-amino acid oxidase-like deaminating enzyme
MVSVKNFDVVVVGTGITGLSAAFHLAGAGIKSVALSGPDPACPATSAASAGLASGGQGDNYTRLSNAHGSIFAKDLWHFGDASYDALAAWCASAGVAFHPARRLRLITSDHELEESEEAARQLAAASLGSILMKRPSAGIFADELSTRIVAVQDDGPRGAWVNVGAALAKLADALPSTTRRLPAVRAIETQPGKGGLTLTLEGGTKARCEMVIVAAHLATGMLVPEIAPALVSVADQWSELRLATPRTGAWAAPGIVFSLNHTYEWGVTRPDGGLAFGGGRYLRPMAGIEAKEASSLAKIEAHLLEQLARSFTFGRNAVSVRTMAALDCRPCDELPIIGPMFGEGRILVATGFMGQGLTQGFFAGRCLAELVAHGAAAALPRRLWPERLRSLEL